MMSIREAITALSCENVLECFFGLNEFDILIYRTLLKLGGARIEQLAETIEKSENTIYKSLQKLMLCGLVFREKKTIEAGGYYYIYMPVEPERVAEKMRKMLGELCKRVDTAINEFVTEFREV
ncbi:helix-turn-helix domain-containing protein [Archaeoglobus veneficus]|uniref:Transcriptional regulator, TrmB n=1 Tax=Archaeoglobus veneficus (strain DSM 11195 / SNP6) TaxID=693661 RepID=F2KNK7_ARCVS|nr:helix-turn-helix domain-containing protein [Archaeoglobus veneficus]AEA46235.1 transcriptional regulator, TrmB [Archaeoglobus veneficus SNP6]